MVNFLVAAGFIAGEILLYLFVNWGYDRLVDQDIAPARRSVKRRVVLAAMLLPLVYAATAWIGFTVVNATPGVNLPELVGITPEGPADPDEPEEVPIVTQAPTGEPLAEATETPAVLAPVPTSAPPQAEEVVEQLPGGKIVYTCQIFKTGFRDQICIIHPDGTGYRRLTEDNDWDHNFPSLSPDGRSVVYIAKPPNAEFEIFEMDLESGNIRQLTEGQGPIQAPAISPNGQWVVYNRLWEGANTIWVMDRNGSNAHMVYGPPQGAGWDPSWSPDGQQILFASDVGLGIQLYVMDADGGNVEQVTNMRQLRGRSDWSPDGTAIASYVGEPWQREIVVMDPNGTNPRLVTNGGNNLSPSFSPDGQWITFTSYRDNYEDELGCEIYIMRRDGTDIVRLTENDICDWQPRWGP